MILDLSPIPGTEDCLTKQDIDRARTDFLKDLGDDMLDVYARSIYSTDPGRGRWCPPDLSRALDVWHEDTDPFENESMATLELIQTWLNDILPEYSLVGEGQAECFGIARPTARIWPR